MRAQSVYKCLSFVLILSLLLVACDAAQEPAPTSEPVEGTVAPTEAAAPTNTPVPEPTEVPKPKVLRVGTTAPAYVSDPEYPGRNSVGMFRVGVNVFEGLVRMDENFQLHPHLAESWEHDEARGVFTFHLRQGITFHDGQPFTADAVVESFNWRSYSKS